MLLFKFALPRLEVFHVLEHLLGISLVKYKYDLIARSNRHDFYLVAYFHGGAAHTQNEYDCTQNEYGVSGAPLRRLGRERGENAAYWPLIIHIA